MLAAHDGQPILISPVQQPLEVRAAIGAPQLVAQGMQSALPRPGVFQSG